MKKLIASLCLLASSAAYASGGRSTWTPGPRRAQGPGGAAERRPHLRQLLHGLHSAKLMRWNRLNAIGLDDQQIREFLIFGNQKVGDR